MQTWSSFVVGAASEKSSRSLSRFSVTTQQPESRYCSPPTPLSVTLQQLRIFMSSAHVVSWYSRCVTACACAKKHIPAHALPSTWLHLHNPATTSLFFYAAQRSFPDSAFFFSSHEGILKVLQSNERMWTLVRSDSMTYSTDSLIEARLPPSRGRIERHPWEPLPFLLRAGKLPRRSATAQSRAGQSGSTEPRYRFCTLVPVTTGETCTFILNDSLTTVLCSYAVRRGHKHFMSLS